MDNRNASDGFIDGRWDDEGQMMFCCWWIDDGSWLDVKWMDPMPRRVGGVDERKIRVLMFKVLLCTVPSSGLKETVGVRLPKLASLDSGLGPEFGIPGGLELGKWKEQGSGPPSLQQPLNHTKMEG